MSVIDILYYAYWIWMPLSLFFFCIRRILWRIQWSSHRLWLAHLFENLFIGNKFSYVDWGWWLLLIAIEILVFQWLCCIFKKITCFINLYWCLWRFGEEEKKGGARPGRGCDVERRRRGEEGTARWRSSRPFLISGAAEELEAAVPPPPAVQGPWFALKQGKGAGPSLSRALFLGAAARLLRLRWPDPVRRHRGEQGARREEPHPCSAPVAQLKHCSPNPPAGKRCQAPRRFSRNCLQR
jgi:hypothetical protein